MSDSLPTLSVDADDRTLGLIFSGRLDARGISPVWDQAVNAVKKAGGRPVRFDLSRVDYLDLAGATFISYLRRLTGEADIPEAGIKGLKDEFLPLLELAAKSGSEAREATPGLSFVENTGKDLALTLADIKTFITFVGEITWAMISSIKNPGSIRWADTWMVAERAGVNALPIVALISFIVGLVMAFQAAIPMKMFGAEIYVANLIGIAMVRELGPLMTAIVLAGRSASAFAAEIGTMKINEEIDALTVMGMDPVKFLIVPRIIAATLITPLLTIFANLVGILGGAVVIISFGYPLITYYNQVAGFVTWQDLTGGLVKCFVFGLLIAATGCIRGYQTLRGPSAVGDSTTRAVVSSIILIAVFDGIFSVVYYYLGV
ncbi:MAG: MlaE family lipid ABC transporter permease subunit [Desulfobacterales bacterium]|nr:MlaE family lipid ABC transporter permease subunit [Desulfobacterales bacterium]